MFNSIFQYFQIQMSDLRQRVSFVREQIHENTRKKRELACKF